MRQLRARASGVLVALLLLGAAPGAPRVDDFSLLDHEGRSHRLSYYGDRKAVVLFVQGNGCPIARSTLPALAAVRGEFAPREVVFLGLNANPQDDRASVAREAHEYGIDFPVLIDETQLVAESLAVTRTAEVLLIATDGWHVVYRGPVDDRLHYEAQRPAREHHLRDALRALLAGKEVETPVREAPGCLIHLRRPRSRRAQRDLLHRRRRAAARAELRRLSPRGRRRSLGDDGLRDRARLGADDPRGGAHAAHAAVARRSRLRPVPQRDRSRRRGATDAGRMGGGRRAARRGP